MKKLYHVKLTEEEREDLNKIIHTGKNSGRKINRARVLLLAADGKKDAEIRAQVGVKASFVERTRQRFAEGGVERALNDRLRPGRPPKLDGKQEALVVALTCSKEPAGQASWTLRLLADKMVKLEVVESISPETVRQVLKKTISSRGSKRIGASQP